VIKLSDLMDECDSKLRGDVEDTEQAPETKHKIIESDLHAKISSSDNNSYISPPLPGHINSYNSHQ
jgi:hypothetical protein